MGKRVLGILEVMVDKRSIFWGIKKAHPGLGGLSS